jgi:hypothetical protein
MQVFSGVFIDFFRFSQRFLSFFVSFLRVLCKPMKWINFTGSNTRKKLDFSDDQVYIKLISVVVVVIFGAVAVDYKEKIMHIKGRLKGKY